MKREISRFICALICCAPIITSAQTSEKITSPANLYKEGRYLFEQKNYAAATASLKAFVKQEPATRFREEAEYMLVCSAYELKDKNSITLLRDYLEPASGHSLCQPDLCTVRGLLFLRREIRRSVGTSQLFPARPTE